MSHHHYHLNTKTYNNQHQIYSYITTKFTIYKHYKVINTPLGTVRSLTQFVYDKVRWPTTYDLKVRWPILQRVVLYYYIYYEIMQLVNHQVSSHIFLKMLLLFQSLMMTTTITMIVISFAQCEWLHFQSIYVSRHFL